MVDTPDQVFVHIVEYLIYFSLTKIEHPLKLISKTPAGNFSEPNDFSDEEGFNLERSVFESDEMNITMIIMNKWDTHLRIINLGWLGMLWPSPNEYITFPNI
jgi:hypothetical protein